MMRARTPTSKTGDFMKRRLALGFSLLFALPALGAARATLEPSSHLQVGEEARLSVTVNGKASRPSPPNVAGASVVPSGQMSQVNIVNGDEQDQTTYLYTLVPERSGPLDIPAMSIGGQTTQPLHTVVAAAPPITGSSSTRNLRDATSAHGSSTRAFLRVESTSAPLFVGQAVPITLRAYFRADTGASLQGEPKLSSDAFVLSGLSSKPVQARVELHGVPYLEASWTGVISPAKPTTQPVAVQLPVELSYREATAQPKRHTLRDLIGDDPFADSFFANSFFKNQDLFDDLDSAFGGGAVRRREATLTANVANAGALPLPTDNVPVSFSGAVGHFRVATDSPSTPPRVGEPVVLTTRVEGTGNFDRVLLPGLQDSSQITTYPGKSSFQPGANGLTGTKTFTQTVVPLKEGALLLPSQQLSFFDPSRRTYETAHSQPLTLSVAAAPEGAVTSLGVPTRVRPDPAVASGTRLPPDLLHASLEPLYRRTWFLSVAVLLALLTGILAAWGWARRSGRLLKARETRHAKRVVSQAQGRMQLAAQEEDRLAFFEAARDAVQARLGGLWGIEPEAITAADVKERLGDEGANLRSVFEQADALRYANGLQPAEPLEWWRRKVDVELKSLQQESRP